MRQGSACHRQRLGYLRWGGGGGVFDGGGGGGVSVGKAARC